MEKETEKEISTNTEDVVETVAEEETENTVESSTKEDTQNKKGANKKKLIKVSCIILAILLILSLLTIVLPALLETEEDYTEIEIFTDYNFYPEDYTEDIFADEEYNALISKGLIEYTSGGVTVTITDENRNNQDEATKFLIDMIYYIQQGDTEKYNSCFSNSYYEKNSRLEKFTQQKIFDVELTFAKEENKEEDNGTSYTARLYELKYRIYKNNGTFRKDLDPNPNKISTRRQYILITNRSGQMLIDNIDYPIDHPGK